MKYFIAVCVLAVIVLACGCTSDRPDVTRPSPNRAPEITSPGTAEATGGIRFCYRVTYDDPDGTIDSIAFAVYPSWLTPDADSISGIPPDGLEDTLFTVVVSDGGLADTAHVAVGMIPCLVVYGDSRTDHQVHQAIVDSLVTLRPAVVFHTGDLVNNGTDADLWVIFNNITATMRAQAEFFPALGNHEYQAQLYFDNFELPNNEQWYSLDRNGVHFIILNSCVETDTASAQYRWLEDDLAAVADSIHFIAAVFHHPPFSTGRHAGDEQGLRETWVPLFERYGVDIVLNGHDHSYERSLCNGIYYIVTGGGGAPLYDQTQQDPCSQLYLKTYHFCKLSVIGGRFVVTVYDLELQIIDRFELAVSPP